MRFIILILTILFCASVLLVSAQENKTLADQDMDKIIHLLNESGLDISYGNDGETIFSMIDSSLTRIILSLSSGDLEGFMDIPLIRETLDYFGLCADEIVISPNESPGRMAAIEAYTRKYGSQTGV